MTDLERIHSWLRHFAACVRNRDLASGQTLFSPAATGFGTRTRHARNRAELVEQQWRPTWENTRDFRFVPGTVSSQLSEDGLQVVVAALWDSLGVKANGDTFPRLGRCTLVLQRSAANEHGYAATHTHFSKDPSGEL